MANESKIALIGGGGIRTPMLIHGLAAEAEALGIKQLTLFDIDHERLNLMAALGREVARAAGSPLRIEACHDLQAAVAGAGVVLSSVRVGGIAARARDEAISLRHGFAGQETTGPGGWAMALRTIPVVLKHAETIQAEAPDAWYISFTNPAGLITQAVTSHTRLRAIGICDTPSELFHQIAAALGEPADSVECDYLGLNHLGWVRTVYAGGKDVTSSLLQDAERLRRIYPAPLFPPELIQQTRLIPSEYVFFCYSQTRARMNQTKAGSTRGGEIERLNGEILGGLTELVAADDLSGAVEYYKQYLRRRSGSYMQLEGNAGSMATSALQTDDPFDAPSGYHRIALSVLRGLAGLSTSRVVVNTLNLGAVADLNPDDVVEVPCRISPAGVEPAKCGSLPSVVRGLVQGVKEYERITIRAAIERSFDLARLALMTYPIVGEWETAGAVATDLIASDPEHLGYLRPN